MVAAALDAAQDAIDALDDCDLRPMMIRSLQFAVAALQQPRIERRQRPGMAHKHQWVESLAATSELRPARTAVFAAMTALFNLVWRPMTSIERKHRQRLDQEQRMLEREREVERQYQVRMAVVQRELDREAAEIREMERHQRDLSDPDKRREHDEQCAKKMREERERHDREEHAKEWLGVGTILRRCGLGRLGSNATLDALRAGGILPSLFEPPSALPSSMLHIQRRGFALDLDFELPRGGLLAAVTDFLNGEPSVICELGVNGDEAVVLHRALSLERFARFVARVLDTLEIVVPTAESVGTVSAEQIGAALYETSKHTDDGCWRTDLDVAERLGAVWLSGGRINGWTASELVRASVLRDAADGLRRCAITHYCMRAVLLETLSRPVDTRRGGMAIGEVFMKNGMIVTGKTSARELVDQMVGLLRNPSMGVSEGHVKALVWFLGRLEYFHNGRLWARYHCSKSESLREPDAPGFLCAMACGSPDRVSLLVEKLFSHSVTLCWPIHRLTWQLWNGCSVIAARPVNISPLHPFSRAEWEWRLGGEMYYSYVRRLCNALLPLAIDQPGGMVLDVQGGASRYLSDVLLLAMQRAASDSEIAARTDAALQSVHPNQENGVPDPMLAHMLAHLLGPASAAWIHSYLERPTRSSSPLPPAFPSDLEDLEIVTCNTVTGMTISDCLPPLGGDTWHADPFRHQEFLEGWEAMQEWIQSGRR